MGFITKVLLLACVAWCGTAAHAHKPSDSYLTLSLQSAGRVNVDWHIALRDLDTELRLDRNDDGQLTWGEVRSRWVDIMNFARPTLSLRHALQDCAIASSAEAPQAVPQVDTHTDGRYAVLRWTAQCPVATGQAWQSLTVDYRLFALTDPSHRGIVRWRAADHQQGTVVLGTPRPVHELAFQSAPALPDSASGSASTTAPPTSAAPAQSPAPEPFLASLWRFVQDGVHHIAIGTDHILFLLSLLLVSVWQRPGRPIWSPAMAGWRARPRWQSALGEVLRLVTAFTIAHSLTLGLAAFGVLSPPSRWVESLIALSVLLAALDNLWQILRAPRWVVVFGFGLVHGFGFAGALQDLGLARGELAAPLLGFNVGVELGQLVLVSVTLPFLLVLRRTAFYRWLIVGGGSLCIAAMALVWLVERVFDIVILGWGG